MDKIVGAMINDIYNRLDREVRELASELPESMKVEVVHNANGESYKGIPALNGLYDLLGDLESMSQDMLRVYPK